MPLYVFKCADKTCDNVVEELMKYDERDTFAASNACGKCHSDLIIGVTMHAKTAQDWAGWQAGLSSNMYSSALGRKVVNQREEEKIAKSMGFIPLSDLKKDFVEQKVEATRAEDAYYDKMNDAYQAKVKEGGDTYGAAIRAVEELMPAKQMLKESENDN